MMVVGTIGRGGRRRSPLALSNASTNPPRRLAGELLDQMPVRDIKLADSVLFAIPPSYDVTVYVLRMAQHTVPFGAFMSNVQVDMCFQGILVNGQFIRKRSVEDLKLPVRMPVCSGPSVGQNHDSQVYVLNTN
ncbi:hypothetical protein GUJ93_ZPchr0008g12275 [Zizania palustris]|uniref:Uncharacterized protein n=1 Tax=Zizania palustris TaxID=103762 RepID=A0A8J5V3Y4_ZIZPA|nr:hypothetical protein GUJ93_ZPchr0008g12275 [Zizania palustris]